MDRQRERVREREREREREHARERDRETGRQRKNKRSTIIHQGIEREPRTFIHVKRAKRFDPVG